MKLVGLFLPVLLCTIAQPAHAAYTSALSGNNITLAGDSASDTLEITMAGGLLQHNRAGDPGFASAHDFNTAVAGDQTVAIGGIISINSGTGTDVIRLGSSTVDAALLSTSTINVNKASGGSLALEIYAQNGTGDYIQTLSATTGPELNVARPAVVDGGVTVFGNMNANITVESSFTGEPVTLSRFSTVTINALGTQAGMLKVNNPPSFTEIYVDGGGLTESRLVTYTGGALSGMTTHPIEIQESDTSLVSVLLGTGNDVLTINKTSANSAADFYAHLGDGSNQVIFDSALPGGLEFDIETGSGDDILNINSQLVPAQITFNGGSQDTADTVTVNGNNGLWLDRPGSALTPGRLPYTYSNVEIVDFQNALVLTEYYGTPEPLSEFCDSAPAKRYEDAIRIPDLHTLRTNIVLENKTSSTWSGITATLDGTILYGGTDVLPQTGSIAFQECLPAPSAEQAILNVSATRDSDQVQSHMVAAVNIVSAPAPYYAWLSRGLATLDYVRLDDPTNIIKTLTLTGLNNEVIIGMDVRPATGELYALTYGRHLFKIDRESGVSTQVGDQLPSGIPDHDFIGFDFIPTADRIRLTTMSGLNVRLHPETGAVAAVDAPLKYMPGEPLADQTVRLTGLAYMNSYPNPLVTSAYGIDTSTRTIVQLPSPNNGLARVVAPLPASGVTEGVYAFDMIDDRRGYLIEVPLAGSGDPTLYQFYNSGISSTVTAYEPLGHQYLAMAIDPVRPTLDVHSYFGTEPAEDQHFFIHTTLSAPLYHEVRADFLLGTGTATLGSDFLANGNTNVPFVFAPGETDKSLHFTLKADDEDEYTETIVYSLINPSGAVVGYDNASVTIDDDGDLPSVVSVAGITKDEGHITYGVSPLIYLNKRSGKEITISYHTANGTAVAGVDYEAAAGTLNIPAGELAINVPPITILGNTIPEANKSFSIIISGPLNATFGIDQSDIVLQNDDGPIPTQTPTPTPTPSPTPIPINQEAIVSMLLKLQASTPAADINGDGIIDAADASSQE